MLQAIKSFFKKKKQDKDLTSFNDKTNDLSDIVVLDVSDYSFRFRPNNQYVGLNKIIDNEQFGMIKIKHKVIYDELYSPPTPFSLISLDSKIGVINNDLYEDDKETLINYLENRKQYVRFKSYFSEFQNTTPNKIASLLMDNKPLKMSEIISVNISDNTSEILNSYRKKTEQLDGSEPSFFVIFDETNPKNYILLSNSPFGHYHQIINGCGNLIELISEL